MVHHLKRAEPFGKSGPWHPLLAMSARRACHVSCEQSRTHGYCIGW